LSYARGCERRLAAGDTGSAQLHGGLRKIAEQAVRAAEVIKTLRALVRKGEGRREWHDPNELVKAALRFIEPEVADAGIVLRARQAELLPYVQVDAIQIEQVILNLLRNALDAFAATANGAQSEIRVTTELRQPGHVEIAVTDNGCGIEAGEVDYIFNEFFTTKLEGLGLGLSISRSIVEAHGGRLWLAESSTTGTTFRFTLPAMQDPASG
jgi:signal transduction histidine kinase